jgi:glycerate kinase
VAAVRSAAPDPTRDTFRVRVLVAPDSFKGSATAASVAAAVRDGWLLARPGDEVALLPLADGGEGTMSTLAAVLPRPALHTVQVTGVTGPREAAWLLTEDGTALVELAVASGLPLLAAPDPMGADTLGFGELLGAAARHPDVRRVVAAVGGSASTDGGTGALTALGARFLDAGGRAVVPGGGSLVTVTRVDLSALAPPPPGGVEVLVDVDAPLLGDRGAAAQFGPQKGADPHQVQLLEAGLAHLAGLLGGDPAARGAGAAGGTAYGLATCWGARLVPGSDRIASLVGLADAVAGADVVVTGEGRLDAQSFRGKVVGAVVAAAAERVPVLGCVGQVGGGRDRLTDCIELVEVAGSLHAALADPLRWAREAGRTLAARRR